GSCVDALSSSQVSRKLELLSCEISRGSIARRFSDPTFSRGRVALAPSGASDTGFLPSASCLLPPGSLLTSHSTERCRNRIRLDKEMRGIPNELSVADDQDLRRFMRHIQALLDFDGYDTHLSYRATST